MEPTLTSGTSVILRQQGPMQNGDLFFFHRPEAWKDDLRRDEVLVKRLVASPGDTFSFDGKSFFTNGEVVYTLPPGYACSAAPQTYSLRLNLSEVVVMGDNAFESYDSRRVFCNGHPEAMFVPPATLVTYGKLLTKFHPLGGINE